MKNYLYCVLSVLLLSSCAKITTPGKTELAPAPIYLKSDTKSATALRRSYRNNARIPVFIMTNRNLKPVADQTNSPDPFGNFRNEGLSPNLAVAEISIGQGKDLEALHQATVYGENRKRIKVKLEKTTVLDSSEGENYKSLLKDKLTLDRSSWAKAIQKQLDKGTSREITIFVHGYNTHLITNTELCAEIYHYGGRDGAIVNFEWPSRGKLLGYFQDKGNAEHSILYLRYLLSELASATGAEKINIIGHSAGCPIVVKSLNQLRLKNNSLNTKQLQKKFKIGRVILAAPDMDKMAFLNNFYDRFYEMADKVAIYISPKDKALLISERVFNQERLGRTLATPTKWEQLLFSTIDDVEIIDVTVPESRFGSFLGHGYFHRDPWVSSDIIQFFSGKPPIQRQLQRRAGDHTNTIWEFPEQYPERIKKSFNRKD